MVAEPLKPLALEDREEIRRLLAVDPPCISELTFSNLFMWRHRFHPRWTVHADCLLVTMQPDDDAPYGLPPAGPGDKARGLARLCDHLRATSNTARIGRAPASFTTVFAEPARFHIHPDRDNADYVYRTADLIHLSGRKYHKKKNSLNKFIKVHSYEYRPLVRDLIQACMELQEDWCRLRDCEDDPGLHAEDLAAREALRHVDELGLQGGAVLLGGKIEAFSLGEPLNPETAVIHIEKANPNIPGLYAAINQRFCQEAWAHLKYINREQDLGIPGLRRAKESYLPDHLVEKFTLILKN